MKIGAKFLIAAIGSVFLGMGAALWYLQTNSFEKAACARIIAEIQKRTGLDCRVENIRLSAVRGRIEIEGLELIPRTGASGLVALKADSVRTTISLSSLWHFRVRLRELNIIHPQVELVSRGGESGWNPEALLKDLQVSLRLEAGKVTARDGRFKINDRSAPFNLSLEALDLEIRYAGELPGYRIVLEYDRSRIFLKQREIIHDLRLSANLSLQGLEVEHLTLRHGASLLTGSGSMKNWKSPVFSIHVAGILDAGDLRLADSSLHEGRGEIGVLADLRSDRDGIYSKGRFSVRTGSYRRASFHDFSGEFEIQHEVLSLRNVSGGIAQGSVHVEGEIQLRKANETPNRIAVKSKNVPLVEVGRLLNLPWLDYWNTADAWTTFTWGGNRGLRADCDVILHSLQRPAKRTGKSTLLGGSMKFTYYEHAGVQISLADLSSPYTTVKASGGKGALFRVQLSTSRISEPLGLIAEFYPSVSDLIGRMPDLSTAAGIFDFNGNVEIRPSGNVTVEGSLSAKNGRWRSYAVDTLSAQAHFSSARLILKHLSIRMGAQSVGGDLELEIAEGERISSLRFRGDAQNIRIPSLKNFGLNTANMDGILSAKGWVFYQRNAWEGDGQISIEKGSFKGERFDALEARVQVQKGRLHLLSAGINRGATRVTVEGQIDIMAGELNLSARMQGFDLAEIAVVRKKSLPVQGRINASGTVSGSWTKPAFMGVFELKDFRYDSWNIGQGKGSLEFNNENVRVSARLQSEFGNLSIQAGVSTAEGFPGKGILEFENLNVQKIIAGRAPPYLGDISTALKGKVEAEGPFGNPAAVWLRGELDGAHFKVNNYEIRNDGQIRFLVVDRDLRLENVRFTGNGTSLYLGGTIPLEDSPNLNVTLNGSVNLGLLEGVQKNLRASGTAVLSIQASGSKRDPQIIGRASFQDARLDYADFPFRLASMQGDVIFSRNLVRLENVRGTAASGSIQISGTLEHRNAVIRSINLEISARNVRVPYPKDFRSVVTARLVLSGSKDIQILSGDIDVIRAEYVKSFSLLEQLTSRGSVQSGPLITEPLLMGLRLNIEIHSENGLLIDNELTRLRAGLRLTLRGTPAYPSLTGRVEATEGTIFFRSNRFQISHATADFVDRNRINPVLEVRAEADVKTYRLILDAVGDLEHLTLNVTSDPPMSMVDILSLLTTGKAETGSATSRQEAAMAGISAASVLSENLTGVIGKRVQRIFGLESFRVDPFLAGTENDPTARVTISERISKDLVVTFSRNLTTTREQIVVIEYDIGKDLSVVGTRDEDGKFGLDFRFRKRLR